MEKPFSIKNKEFKENLVSCINGSGLPLLDVQNILVATINEVTSLIAKEEQEYFESLNADEESEVSE